MAKSWKIKTITVRDSANLDEDPEIVEAMLDGWEPFSVLYFENSGNFMFSCKKSEG